MTLNNIYDLAEDDDDDEDDDSSFNPEVSIFA